MKKPSRPSDILSIHVKPPGWEPFPLAGVKDAYMRVMPSGLAAIFSIETHDKTGKKMRHLSLSRSDRYPSWDEMRDFIYSCGLFRDDRDIMMILPPKGEYVNLHNNCFHWYQEV